ncbi:MAG: hypothetical protein RLZZ312_292 [Bacteroidota bacterium]
MFKTSSNTRIAEYKLLTFRLLLVYVFYFVARCLFFFYNSNLIEINSVSEFFMLYYHGLVFDTTAILYVNLLFILLSVIPFFYNTTKKFQKTLFFIYFSTNLIAFATNFIDFVYYRFNFGRSTIAALDSLKNESNKSLLFKNFLFNYWHVFILFFLCMYLWIFLYKKVNIQNEPIVAKLKYFSVSIFMFLVVTTLAIGGIRGDFQKSTRPINILDASRHVNHVSQADFVLNTPFSLIRTAFSNSFKKINLVTQSQIDSLVQPIKQYKNNQLSKKNVVIFILESNGREYFSSFNKHSNIKNFIGYAPFVDSLAQHSLIFANAYANGYKSIHAMSSVLAGIPSFKDAFTSSPYPKQKTESLISTLESIGYKTSFYHGAPNGSMGFLGYSKILGIDNYFGKTEYKNDADFDGVWGIWDEPFLQFFNKSLSATKQPFCATLFSVSSHEPYIVPKKYQGKFPIGDVNIHQTIGYTDFALKQFFAKAKNQPWFKNTIFIMVGDHTNTVFYDNYKKVGNQNAVMMLLYDPIKKYVGDNLDFAQQIDIYPTILDIIGYQKPFRSWGRSLVDTKKQKPFLVKWTNNLYELRLGNYTITFDGKNIVGIYDKNDLDWSKNLISQTNPEIQTAKTQVKAFVQDYMARIIDKKLDH